MPGGTLLAAPYLDVTKFVSLPDLLELHAVSRQPSSACPLCQTLSAHVQSRYFRTLADLPWQGVAVRIKLKVRRFFCDSPDCPRKIFTERLPQVVAPYSRRTHRLADAIELIGFVLGGEQGARTAKQLGILTSPDTLLRAVRRTVVAQQPTPRVLGIDDWAIRRGHRYGTVLVDLERRCRIDVLEDRTTETLAAWLKAHPGIEIISRDRAGAYAQAAQQGAPLATQIADRWHLLKNLGEALERFFASRHKMLGQVASTLTASKREAALNQHNNSGDGAILTEATLIVEGGPSTLSRQPNQAQRNRSSRRQRRMQRYDRVVELAKAGLSRRAIARETGLSRMTVRKYLNAGTFPEIASRPSRCNPLSAYLPYMQERWSAGCRNASQMWRELKERGFEGTDEEVRRTIRAWRSCDGRPESRSGIAGPKPEPIIPAPSPRKAKWLMVRDEEDLEEKEREMRDKIVEMCPDAEKARQLAIEFQQMIRERKVEELGRWMEKARASGIAEMSGFAQGLEQDRAAVEAALKYEWSNGQLEGQVNRIKAIKRAMYGRAKFDLLRLKILRAS